MSAQRQRASPQSGRASRTRGQTSPSAADHYEAGNHEKAGTMPTSLKGISTMRSITPKRPVSITRQNTGIMSDQDSGHLKLQGRF